MANCVSRAEGVQQLVRGRGVFPQLGPSEVDDDLNMLQNCHGAPLVGSVPANVTPGVLCGLIIPLSYFVKFLLVLR